MKTSPFMKRAVFNFAMLFIVGLLSLATVATAFAQSGPTGPTPPPFTPVIVVTPVVAPVGAERRITVSGIWPNGCIPVGITPMREAASLTRALPIRLEISTTAIACTQATTPYSYTTTFTPTTSGDFRLIVYGSDAVSNNEILMAVQSTDTNRSLYNLTGMWFDLATSGSGIVFVHSYTTTDSVFGAWFLYDQQGQPRWYSIQEGRWKDGTEFNGTLYETSAAPASCASNLSACPLPFRSLRRIGAARVTMAGRFDVKLEALASDGSVLFSSTMVRGL
jgi:hypothetical protein